MSYQIDSRGRKTSVETLALGAMTPFHDPDVELGKVVDFLVGTRCSTCHLRDLCLPSGLAGQDVGRMDELISSRKRVKRGQRLYYAGETFHSLYAIRSGFFKSSLLLEDGLEQVGGFHMMGDLMGMDGIGSGSYTCSAIALEDAEVCLLPYAHLEHLSRRMPSLQPHFHRLMSREIMREHNVMLMLGSMRTEQRLAAFLLNLSQRLTARGYSPFEFNLRMTREDIGSFLGMKLETISRMFTKFQDDRVIDIKHRKLLILDPTMLKDVLAHGLPGRKRRLGMRRSTKLENEIANTPPGCATSDALSPSVATGNLGAEVRSGLDR